MCNRIDLFKFLYEKHNASLSIEDFENCSPKKLASASPLIMMLVNKVENKKAFAAYVRYCEYCASEDGAAVDKKCSRCQCVYYCSVECQRKDWKKGHKAECASIAIDLGEGFLITPNTRKARQTVTDTSTGVTTQTWNGQLPSGHALDEVFHAKIKLTSGTDSIIICDKTQSLYGLLDKQFVTNFDGICRMIRSFEPQDGKAAHFFAKFVKHGTTSSSYAIFVSNKKMFVRKW